MSDVVKLLRDTDRAYAGGTFLGKAADLIEAQQARIEELTTDKERLEAIQTNLWDVRCFDVPTGAGDADVGWRVVSHYMAEPRERTIAEVYREDELRACIDRALQADKGDGK